MQMSMRIPAPPPTLQYREVPCNYQPPKPAQAISNPTPGELGSSAVCKAAVVCQDIAANRH